MNLIFKTIRWKNFLSTGNSFTEIKLDKFKTTLIVGENGCGKSTLLDALTFALFNKPFRKINKPQLINSINKKDMLVEVEFDINKIPYSIRRGMKPNIFEIYKNGVLLNQSADNRDHQEILEKQILKSVFKTFCQVVILGSASFVPFMQLPANQRREIIEDLLDLQVFSTMNILLKDRINVNYTNIINSEANKNSLNTQIKLIKNHIEVLKESSNKILNEKMDRIKHTNKLVTESLEQTTALKKKISDLKENLTDSEKLTKELNKIIQYEGKLNDKIKKLNNEITFYHSNDNCPTCRQNIENTFKCEIVSDRTLKLDETTKGLELLKEKYENVNKKLKDMSEIQIVINDLNLQLSALNTKISSWNEYISELNQEIENHKKSDVSTTSANDLKNIEKQLKQAEKEYAQLIDDREVLSTMQVLLKDGGIKSKIIKQYVPVMNKLINKYLQAMGFYVNFELNEQFEETIKSRYRDEFSYASFSEGEKMRINIAILFAWRSISKLRNSINTNLLIMDEIFDGSLDTDGIDEFVKILETLTQDTNTFIISHKTDQMLDKFDNVMKFNKVQNFSRLV